MPANTAARVVIHLETSSRMQLMVLTPVVVDSVAQSQTRIDKNSITDQLISIMALVTNRYQVMSVDQTAKKPLKGVIIGNIGGVVVTVSRRTPV